MSLSRLAIPHFIVNFRLSLYNKVSKILFSGFVQSLLSFPIIALQNSNVIAARYSNDLNTKGGNIVENSFNDPILFLKFFSSSSSFYFFQV